MVLERKQNEKQNCMRNIHTNVLQLFKQFVLVYLSVQAVCGACFFFFRCYSSELKSQLAPNVRVPFQTSSKNYLSDLGYQNVSSINR